MAADHASSVDVMLAHSLENGICHGPVKKDLDVSSASPRREHDAFGTRRAKDPMKPNYGRMSRPIFAPGAKR
jgi:hypothetical protein